MPHRSVHHGLHPIKLNLSHAQVLKARAGHQVQVAHHQIGHGHTFHLHPETHKKLHTAHRARKGARIHITHPELAGSGFLDILKKVASPVLSGLQGVAKELFPSHAGTIDSIREGIRGATGYGIRTHKKSGGSARALRSSQAIHHRAPMHGKGGFMHAGDDPFHSPEHFPGMHTDHYGSSLVAMHHSNIGRHPQSVHHSEGSARALRSSQPSPKRKAPKRKHKKMGMGINPSGYGY